MENNYTGNAYIGVVGGENENGECRDSIDMIQGRQGDVGPQFIRATKGYEARQLHFNNWLEKTQCEFMFLVDSDMKFPRDILERLRSHGLPYVSGLYMRRRYAPVAPVWFEPMEELGKFPFRPFVRKIEPGKLYEIGASGWGCILIHRSVAKAVDEILKGEPFVIEDDMDVWPYDLKAVLEGREQLRPLRGVKDPIGSDIRFPFYAKVAGFQLYGDSGARCSHMLNYPLSPDDFDSMPEEVIAKLTQDMIDQYNGEREKIERSLK